MKLGVLVSLTGREALDRKFADLKKYGFESCQLCSWDPAMWTDERRGRDREDKPEYKVKLSAAFWTEATHVIVGDFCNFQLLIYISTVIDAVNKVTYGIA